MMAKRNWMRIMGLVAVAALPATCNKAPTHPTTTLPSTTSGPTSTTRTEITVTESLPPGETAQFTATAFFLDGSSRNVTSEAEWKSADVSVLSFSGSRSGLAMAHKTGEAYVRAAFNGEESGQRGVLVLPTGTFKVGGYVEDGGVGVPQARVEITAGHAAGLFVPSSSGGSYSLLGVSGDTEFRVSKDGYEPLVRTVRVTSHQQINFHLTPLTPRPELAGTSSLTISAAGDCRSLPDDVRIQRYTAVLTQNLARLTLTLAGADFVSDASRTYNSFDGVIEPSRVSFELRYADFYLEDPLGDSGPSTSFSEVFARLTPSTFLVVGGTAVVTGSPARLSGTLNGIIETLKWVGTGEPRVGTPTQDWQRLTSCRSTAHEFVLSR